MRKSKKNILEKMIFCSLIFTLIIVGCDTTIERSGFIVDDKTNEPLQGVSIEVYLKNQRGDSLLEKVFTDNMGYFYISEKRSTGLLFELNKSGYISHVSTLSIKNDTIKLERTAN